jgi:hypothetical protein
MTLSALQPEILSREHPQRSALERFIAHSYARIYSASVTHYAEELVGMRRPDGDWDAGDGYTIAKSDPLFIEHYLDQPVEAVISDALGARVQRSQVVEVGNLAAPGSGAARRLIVHMTRLLYALDRTWVVFTSTRALLNSFNRLGIATIGLGRADPARLQDGGASWGSYYETDPQVVTANIPLGFMHLGAGEGSL